MATDLSSTARPASGTLTKRVAMDATAGNTESVQFPEWCRAYDVYFKQSDDSTDDSGKVAETGTDGAAIGNDFFPVPSGNALTVTVAPGRSRVLGGATHFLAAGTNGAFAHLTLRTG